MCRYLCRRELNDYYYFSVFLADMFRGMEQPRHRFFPSFLIYCRIAELIGLVSRSIYPRYRVLLLVSLMLGLSALVVEPETKVLGKMDTRLSP